MTTTPGPSWDDQGTYWINFTDGQRLGFAPYTQKINGKEIPYSSISGIGWQLTTRNVLVGPVQAATGLHIDLIVESDGAKTEFLTAVAATPMTASPEQAAAIHALHENVTLTLENAVVPHVMHRSVNILRSGGSVKIGPSTSVAMWGVETEGFFRNKKFTWNEVGDITIDNAELQIRHRNGGPITGSMSMKEPNVPLLIRLLTETGWEGRVVYL